MVQLVNLRDHDITKTTDKKLNLNLFNSLNSYKNIYQFNKYNLPLELIRFIVKTSGHVRK